MQGTIATNQRHRNGVSAGISISRNILRRIGIFRRIIDQSVDAIAIGLQAGENSQGPSAIAIGPSAGFLGQQSQAIAIGNGAAGFTQGANAIAIGASASTNSQGTGAIAIGYSAVAANNHKIASL